MTLSQITCYDTIYTKGKKSTASILKKWKKSWVELYRDGHLKYYENECSPNAEDIIFMPTECLAVKAGLQVEGVQPPEGYGVQNLLSVITSTGKTWVFCGESLDDMRAWQLALEQARIFGMHPHLSGHPSAYMSGYNSGYLPAYTGDTSVTFLPQFTYPPPAYYGYPGPQYMTANPGQTALVYHPERYRPDGTDMAMGMLGGAAVGSLMWGPLLWW
ncbi:unnamed protein product [Larinioides sclopetarius]|uniref:PH domain-containing protein n=1 Tax=Larinioides sclopetarius TaxID=280406 RepID=A0AAV1ZPQ8_9ARAC